MKANASKHKAMSYGRMVKEEEQLRKEVEQILKKMDQTDREEDKKYGNRRGYELPEELSNRQKRLEAIEKEKIELEEEARQKCKDDQDKRRKEAGKQGKKYTPRKDAQDAKPKDKDQRNFTDSESRIMKDSNKAFIQGYSAQATVDAETHIIVGAKLCNIAGDSPHLVNQIEEVEKNTGRKLKTKPGKKICKLRQTSVEPVFGFIKEQLGVRQFLLRGQTKAASTWRFTCAVHNLLKIYRAQVAQKKESVVAV